MPKKSTKKKPRDIIIGTKHSLHSKILGEERPYWLYLPESYNNKTLAPQHYPVLYLLDGDAHFHWASGVVQFMSAGINGNIQIPELIVVALPNTDRTRDLTPTHSKVLPDGKEAEFLKTSGGGDTFLQFIGEELFTHIESTYRTLPYKILVGHSFGGLLALHALLVSPEMFQAYIAIDPSFWWDDKFLVRKLESRNKTNVLSGAVYIGLANHTGIGEYDLEHGEKPSRAFASSLETFASETFRSHLQDFKSDDHGSVPLQSLYHGLLYIFEGHKPPINVLEQPSILVEHFEKFSKRFGRAFLPPEGFTDMLGHVVLEDEKDIDKSVEFFKLNVSNYPNSPNVYASLAKAYEIKGDKQLAINNLEKSLELNPDNQSVKDQLQKLRENQG